MAICVRAPPRSTRVLGVARKLSWTPRLPACGRASSPPRSVALAAGRGDCRSSRDGSRRAQRRRPPTSTRATSAAWSAPRGASGARGGAPTPPLVEPDAVPAVALRSQGSRATASTSARAWRPNARCRGGPCRAACSPSEQEFRREIIRRDTADRPEALRAGARHRRGRPPHRGREDQRLVPGDGHRRGGLGQGRQLPPAAARPAPGPTSSGVSHAGAGDRDRRAAHREARDDRAQLPAGARERDPRARRRQQGRADRAAPPSTPSATPRIRSRPARRRAPRTARSRSAGSTAGATSCARRSSAGCPRR